jgi:hypothetical protein
MVTETVSLLAMGPAHLGFSSPFTLFKQVMSKNLITDAAVWETGLRGAEGM